MNSHQLSSSSAFGIRPSALPRRLAEFEGIHAGKTAWMFGKGPSFERFDLSTAGPLRMCVNETCYAVPDPTYLCALDRLNGYAHRIPRGIECVFHPARTVRDRFLCAVLPPPEIPVCIFEDTLSTIPLENPYHALQELHRGEGTAVAAIQILHIMRVARVVFVGFDGGGGYGREWFYRHRPEFDRAYGSIRAFVARLCAQWGIEADFSPSGGPCPHDDFFRP